MTKRSGTIVLDEEVRDPGKCVRNNQSCKYQPGTAKQDRRQQQNPTRECSSEMKPTGHRPAVGKNVFRPEFLKGQKWIRHGRFSPEILLSFRGASIGSKKAGPLLPPPSEG